MRPGYQQTEVGVIPEDWEIASLGKIASIDRGKFSARPRNDPKYYGGDIPFIQTGDVARSRGLISDFSQTLNTEGLKVSRLFPKGTLFFTIAANIGDVGISAFDAACPDSLVAITPGPFADKNWLFAELGKRKSEFENLASPGAQLNINLEKLRPFLLPFPPLPEQRAIAAALSDVDAALAGVLRLIAKKKDLKQAAMQTLLTGQTRLPGFSGEWKVKRLGECLAGRPSYGINAAAVPFSDRLPAYIRITDIDADGNFSPDPLVSVDTASTEYDLSSGDLVFARTGASVGKSFLYDESLGRLIFAGFLIRIRPDPTKLTSRFLAEYAKTARYWNWVTLMSMRSGQPGINGQEYEQLPLLLPSVEEQTAIATILSEMDAEIAALTAQADKTRLLKQAMMQELLTGRTRLPLSACHGLEDAHA